MAGKTTWSDELGLPTLLRLARATYADAVRQALAAAGFGDMPRNGSFVVGAVARGGAPLGRIIEGLGVSKQAGGQLIDGLVARGYLERAVDPADRRRLTVTLTARGRGAAAVTRKAVDRIDAQLARRIGPLCLAHARATLTAIAEINWDERKNADAA